MRVLLINGNLIALGVVAGIRGHLYIAHHYTLVNLRNNTAMKRSANFLLGKQTKLTKIKMIKIEFIYS